MLMVYGCDLLSNSFCSIFEYNVLPEHDIRTDVVICFQILFVRSLNTTTPIDGLNRIVL